MRIILTPIHGDRSHENQDKLDVSVKKMKQLVLDDLDTFKSEVLEKNKQLSDDIDAIPRPWVRPVLVAHQV